MNPTALFHYIHTLWKKMSVGWGLYTELFYASISCFPLLTFCYRSLQFITLSSYIQFSWIFLLKVTHKIALRSVILTPKYICDQVAPCVIALSCPIRLVPTHLYSHFAYSNVVPFCLFNKERVLHGRMEVSVSWHALLFAGDVLYRSWFVHQTIARAWREWQQCSNGIE